MRNGYWIASLALASFVAVGCEDSNYQEYKAAPLSEGHDAHDHGAVGPYDGHVLEMDDAHGHHAEIVMDSDTRDITVYFYGAQIGSAVAASNVVLELHEGDAHKDVTAKASPIEGETAENASRWVFAGSDMPAGIKSEEQLDGHLKATLGGKDFSASLEPHSHNDADHGHDDHAHSEKGDAAHSDADHVDAGHDDHKTAEPKAK